MTSPRVALCISGQPRSFEIAYPLIKRHVIDCNPNIDVFIHTWYDESNAGQPYRETSNTLGGVKPATETVGTPERIRKMYAPLKMRVEPQQDFSAEAKMFPEVKRDETNPFGSLSMWTSIRRCNDLKREYEQEHGFVYDYVIRYRFDTVLLKRIDLSKMATDVYHAEGIRLGDRILALYDHTFICSSRQMDIVAQMIDRINNYLPVVGVWNNEALLMHHLKVHNIPIQTHRWYTTMVRGETLTRAVFRSIKNYAKSDIISRLSKFRAKVTLLVRFVYNKLFRYVSDIRQRAQAKKKILNSHQFFIALHDPTHTLHTLQFREGYVLLARGADLNGVTESCLFEDYTKYADIKQGSIVYDLGSCIGDFAILAAYRGATVVAIEPDPENFAILQQNIALNGMQEKITALNVAVDKQSGVTFLDNSPANTGGYRTNTNTGVSVTCKTLQEIMNDLSHDHIDLLKIDVEGAEYTIFTDMATVNASHIREIVGEYHLDNLRPHYSWQNLHTLLKPLFPNLRRYQPFYFHAKK